MKKLTIFLLLASCTGYSSHAAASGMAYTQSVTTAINACDWSEHESDNEPGCAYREGQAAAEDADCVEDHE